MGQIACQMCTGTWSACTCHLLLCTQQRSHMLPGSLLTRQQPQLAANGLLPRKNILCRRRLCSAQKKRHQVAIAWQASASWCCLVSTLQVPSLMLHTMGNIHVTCKLHATCYPSYPATSHMMLLIIQDDATGCYKLQPVPKRLSKHSYLAIRL